MEQELHFRKVHSAGLFRSTRLSKAAIENNVHEKHWTQGKEGKASLRKSYIVVLCGIFGGLFAGLLWLGMTIFTLFKNEGKYCLVMEDHFNGPLNTSLWNHEVSVGGFGNAEFEWTTSSPNNSWTEDGILYITPTFTSDRIGLDALNDGYFVNLTADGTCTTPESKWTKVDKNNPMQVAINSTHTNCVARSNATLGTMVPPIQSARINTNGTASIRYGRVEFRIRIPTGDWLWPAVWMMPEESVYGEWPASGEIDIFESRSNIPKHKGDQNSNYMQSTIHVGYSLLSNIGTHFLKARLLFRNWYNEDFHTIGLEWDENGIWTWEGSRNVPIMHVKFNKRFYDRLKKKKDDRGNFIPMPNPWITSPNNAAPFDQKFYLIINLAVGGLNGYWDHQKPPWSQIDPNGVRTFWNVRDRWLPTWAKDKKKRSFAIDYVKMWQRCG